MVNIVSQVPFGLKIICFRSLNNAFNANAVVLDDVGCQASPDASNAYWLTDITRHTIEERT